MSDALVDHHTHLFSPEASRVLGAEVGKVLPPFTAGELLATMDSDDVATSVVLSTGYLFGTGDDTGADGWTCRHENDWVAEQVARAPGRLVAFFSVNPLDAGAEDELLRCHERGSFAGLKLHLANARVRFDERGHLERVVDIVSTTAERGLPIVCHLRTDGVAFGAPEAGAFADAVLPAAAGVPVQLAHVGGWGGYDDATAAIVDRFVEAIGTGAITTSSLLFDLSAVVRGPATAAGGYARLGEQLRRIGYDRLLFGTDWPDWSPASYLTDLRRELALDEDGVRALRRNRAPWTRTASG